MTDPKPIISPSGMRGKVGVSLKIGDVVNFTLAYGSWLGTGSDVLVGRDTRPSGRMFSYGVISALMSVGINVIDAGVVPTPAVLFYKRKYNLNGAVIISGSHNPPDQNGIKYLADRHTFLGHSQLSGVNSYMNKPAYCGWKKIGNYRTAEIIGDYTDSLKHFIEGEIFEHNPISVVVDPGAGAGTGITSGILRSLGCNIREINTSFINGNFPREIEPIAPNLEDLAEAVREEGADLGIAHDCDADRVAIADSDGKIYPEDVMMCIILDYMLRKMTGSEPEQYPSGPYGTLFASFDEPPGFYDPSADKYIVPSDSEGKIVSLPVTEKIFLTGKIPEGNSPIVVTNIASTLVIEKIAAAYGGVVIRTPVGERHLAVVMDVLTELFPGRPVLGGEGSSGGFMYPPFNNARDGIFAGCKVAEIISYSGIGLRNITKRLPELYRFRSRLPINRDVKTTVQNIARYLSEKNISHYLIGKDILVLTPRSDSWILIHPSNTEPIIRIIAEGVTPEDAENSCKKMENVAVRIGSGSSEG